MWGLGLDVGASRPSSQLKGGKGGLGLLESESQARVLRARALVLSKLSAEPDERTAVRSEVVVYSTCKRVAHHGRVVPFARAGQRELKFQSCTGLVRFGLKAFRGA